MKINRVFHYSLLFLLFWSTTLCSQNKRWTLQECIDYALEHNFQVNQNNLQVQQSKANLLQSKGMVLPSVSGSANHTYNTGRRIDPFTNQFANSVVLSQNFSVSGSMNLFSGLSNTNNIIGNQLALLAAQYSNEQIKNDVSLNIANAFLQILLADELLSIAQNQLKLITEQRDRAKLLYEAGRTARGDLLQVEAQLSSEELNVVRARNSLDLAYLTLAQMLPLENAEGFEIEKPDLSKMPVELPAYGVREVYATAESNYPSILASDFNYRSQQRFLKSAKGAYLPSLSVFGGVGTGYSQLSRTQVGSALQTQYIGSIQGQDLYVDVPVPVYEKTPYRDQMDQNFNRTVGFSLSVPIFSNFRTKTQVAMQRIAVENAALQQGIARNELLRNIQTAWLDARSAYERFMASQKSVEAMRESFGYISQRFEVGMVSPFEYNTSKNQLAAAESDLAQARYECILRLKVLDFYQGKPIRF